jgi:carbamoyltransferase
MDIAFSLQKVFEHAYLGQASSLHTHTGETRVAIAGGCALNSVANGLLLERTPFAETCIQPAASDDGLAMGAALYVSNVILKEGRRWVMENSYLGDAFSGETIRAALEVRGIHYTEQPQGKLVESVADHLAKGDVVGWFQGRMEWGPRALGNRSILVHPGFPNMKDILNARIKRREWFRPFAPAVLKERQGEIFGQTHASPFMLHVFGIKQEWRERLSAVVHEDNTGRLQTVARHENPLYYSLISAFERRTGIPVLLNTSFNENEPIVRTPDEAIDCFLRTRMDVLAIGSFLCAKNARQ